MPTRIALAQINPTVGDIQGNLELIRQTLSRVGTEAQLVVFPEGSLPGYPAQDLLLERAFLADLQAALEALAAEITDQWVIIGTVREESGSSPAVGGVSAPLQQLAVGSWQQWSDRRLGGLTGQGHFGGECVLANESVFLHGKAGRGQMATDSDGAAAGEQGGKGIGQTAPAPVVPDGPSPGGTSEVPEPWCSVPTGRSV